jgi:hypothetical protein
MQRSLTSHSDTGSITVGKVKLLCQRCRCICFCFCFVSSHSETCIPSYLGTLNFHVRSKNCKFSRVCDLCFQNPYLITSHAYKKRYFQNHGEPFPLELTDEAEALQVHPALQILCACILNGLIPFLMSGTVLWCYRRLSHINANYRDEREKKVRRFFELINAAA